MSPRLPSKASRIGRLEKWLAQQVNPLIVELQLELDGDAGPERVASWARDKAFKCDAVAVEIDDMLASIAAEQESRVVGRLVWLTDQAQRWTTYPVKVEPENGSQAFDGTAKNLLVQNQRHLEAMAMTWTKATMSVLGTHESTLTALVRLVETRENRTADLEEEMARLRDQNAQLQLDLGNAAQVAEQAVEGAEAAAEELVERKRSEGTDQQMLTLLGRVTGMGVADK